MTQQLTLPKDVALAAVTFDVPLSRQAFAAFCSLNPDIIAELTPDGKVQIMSAVTALSAYNENIISTMLTMWALRGDKGDVFSASGGFDLPDGSVRCPDAVFVSRERMDELPDDAMDSYLPVVPDFVVEVRSKSDSLAKLRRKMTDTWMANGVRLAWLVDIKKRRVFFYHRDGQVECIEDPTAHLNGGDVLPGFEFDLGMLRW